MLGEYPSLCVRNMHTVRTQCKNLAKMLKVTDQIPKICKNIQCLEQGAAVRKINKTQKKLNFWHHALHEVGSTKILHNIFALLPFLQEGVPGAVRARCKYLSC